MPNASAESNTLTRNILGTIGNAIATPRHLGTSRHAIWEPVGNQQQQQRVGTQRAVPVGERKIRLCLRYEQRPPSALPTAELGNPTKQHVAGNHFVHNTGPSTSVMNNTLMQETPCRGTPPQRAAWPHRPGVENPAHGLMTSTMTYARSKSPQRPNVAAPTRPIRTMRYLGKRSYTTPYRPPGPPETQRGRADQACQNGGTG